MASFDTLLAIYDSLEAIFGFEGGEQVPARLLYQHVTLSRVTRERDHFGLFNSSKIFYIKRTSLKMIRIISPVFRYFQSQPKLNFIFNFEADIALFSDKRATHPTTHPTRKVVKWNET